MSNRSLALTLAAGLAPRTKAAVSALGVRDVFGLVRESFAGAWQKGVVVDPIGDLTAFGAVYACLTLIANDIGKLRPCLLEVGDTKTPAMDAAPHWRALRKPNAYQTRQQFYRAWLISKLIFGNVYVLKVREEFRGMVAGMHILDPRRVTPMVTPDGDVYYSLGGSDLARIPVGQVVPASEIIHDRCPTLWHPLVGVPPIYAAATTATHGRRIQMNAAKFFENMSRPSGMLTAPATIDDVTALRLKTEWEKNYSGENIGKLAVLGDGLKYEPMTIPPEQAQLIDQLKWTAVDIAGSFHVPAYKINVGQMPTSNNVEALQQQYYESALQVHIEDIETLLEEGLEVPSTKCVEFDLEGLLRMDSATQVETLAKAVGGAIMAPNEARRKRNLKPVPGGDSVYLQQQNFSLEALAKRDAQADPFGTAKPKPAEPATPPSDTPAANDPQAQAAAEAAGAKAIEAQRTADAATAQVRELLDRLQVLERAAVPVTLEAGDAYSDADIRSAEALFFRSLGIEAVSHG